MRIAGLPFDIGWFLCGSMAFGKVLFLRRGKTWGRKSTPTSSLFTRHATERQVDATSCCSLVSPVRLCDPMDSSTPGFPVLHHFPVFAQTHIYWVDDTIQPSHPLVLNLSQHQGLFQWVCSLHQVAKVFIAASASVLPMNIQGWFPSDWLVWSCYCPRKSQESSPTPQFKSRNSLGQAFFMVQLSYLYMITGKTTALTRWTFVGKVMSLLFILITKGKSDCC